MGTSASNSHCPILIFLPMRSIHIQIHTQQLPPMVLLLLLLLISLSSLRGRLRSRLEDLANLSGRSLFGRVVRLPSLFPFKRQEEETTDKDETAGSRRRSKRRRRKKDSDRQMISINGKQYYINDEGELKELKDDKSED